MMNMVFVFMKTQLKTYLNKYVQFTEQEIDIIFNHLIVENFKKKEFLLPQNAICKRRYFIIEGLVRLFYIDANGVEKTVLFGVENWWITNLDSFVKEIPSEKMIQALENTVVLSITREELEKLYRLVPKLERAFRKITENMLISIQRKDEVFMKKSSRERYSNLIRQIPDFANRVPQYMIASYLGISPEYLSELRKQD